MVSSTMSTGKKPIWERYSILWLLEKLSNLVFKIEQKSLTRQLLMQLPIIQGSYVSITSIITGIKLFDFRTSVTSCISIVL